MEETYILGNSQVIQNLGLHFVEIPLLNNDIEIHNWIKQLFHDNNVQKLVIEIGSDPVTALKISYHIRLSIEELREKAIVPILFVSNLSLNSVIMKGGIYSQILATTGIYFSEFESLDIIRTEIDNIELFDTDQYLTTFLRIIHILPEEMIGRHSLANIWGAYAMDSAANTNVLPRDADFRKKLYYKYLSAFNKLNKLNPSSINIIGHIPVGHANRIIAEGKKVLLIDDEADTGWESVLRKVFKTTHPDDFVVINEQVMDYDAFTKESKDIIEGEDFDLYLIDLRLNGLDEDYNTRTEDFSGAKVLKKIKSLNQGHQVIMFTASNKSWNLKSLLEYGADGYYLKESPEYHFSVKQSEQNYIAFQNGVSDCFERGYLKVIFRHWMQTKSQTGNPDREFILESSTALGIAWEQIKNDFLDFAFLTIFQTIESYARKNFIKDYNAGNFLVNDEVVIEITMDRMEKWSLTYNYHGYFGSGVEVKERNSRVPTLYIISCLLKFKYNKDDEYLRNFGRINQLRNNIAHGTADSSVAKDDLIEILNIFKELRSGG